MYLCWTQVFRSCVISVSKRYINPIPGIISIVIAWQDPPLNKCFSGKTIMSSLIGWLVGHHHDVISLHTLQQGVHPAIITP